MIKKKYQMNRNEKFFDKVQQCFAFLHIKPKNQICRTVKLIPWNVVNRSHLYIQALLTLGRINNNFECSVQTFLMRHCIMHDCDSISQAYNLKTITRHFLWVIIISPLSTTSKVQFSFNQSCKFCNILVISLILCTHCS